MATQAIGQSKIQTQDIRIGEGASTAVLLVLMLLSVTGSVNAANWADGLSTMAWAAMGGLIVGIFLAKLPVWGWLAHILALVLGAGATALLVTSLLPDVLTFKERFIVLQERVMTWFIKATTGGVSTDNLMFIIQVAFLSWIMAYLAAWFVYRRHQVWGAILPTGAGILFNLYYAAPQTGIYFGLYVLCALLLLVRLNLRSLEEWWRRAAIGYASDISFDFLVYGIVFSLVLMTVAWVVPGTAPGPSWFDAFGPFQGPWQSAEDQFNRVFSSLRAVARPSSTNFVGTTLTMGGPVNLGQRPVMDVTSNAGRYWRASVYDKYTGIGWINTRMDAADLPAGDPRINTDVGNLRAVVTQTFKIYMPDQQNVLYAESEPVAFNIPVEVRYGNSPSTDASSSIDDIALARARRPLRYGDTYSVISLISVADEQSLRQASTQYPESITSIYLQLPNTLPERVRQLAQTITAPYTNPYDKAVAIEQYLRTHIRYNDNVSPPPPGRDGVDYTLFDRPEGYCNYYASAMAVLARAIGIPSRVASGYALGDYKNGVFHIVEANAHAWPELYFPGYGWIEFEPTASQPEIGRPKKPADVPTQQLNSLNDQKPDRRSRFDPQSLQDEGLTPGAGLFSFDNPFWSDPRNVGLVGGGFVLLLAVGAVAGFRWNYKRRAARLSPATRVYGDLLRLAHWLGIRDQEHATPFERARLLEKSLPGARNEIELTASLYVREKFGARPLDETERLSLSAAWSRVSAEWRYGVARVLVHKLVDPPRALAAAIRDRMSRLRHRGRGLPLDS